MQTITPAPRWFADVLYTVEEDLSDVWMEETDLGNFRGEICTGFFGWDDEYGRATLLGVQVEGEGAPYVIDAADLAERISAETVDRVERVVSEQQLERTKF